MKVSWISAGVSSFVATYMAKPDLVMYIDIDDQHPDSMRFLNDCEGALGQKIVPLKSRYGNVENACLSFGFISSPYGAKCTDVLKRRVRKEWERSQSEPLTYIWGFDCTETERANRLIESMPNMEHKFPLIDHSLTKNDAHGLCNRLGVKRPVMYDMGYGNNNCVGCVKGGKGYWNKIRVDFPDVFAKRAKMERIIGHSCINGVYLDELDPAAGRMASEIMQECGIFCMMADKALGGEISNGFSGKG